MALLEGLEASVIRKSDWETDNNFLRLDSEFWIKDYSRAIDAVRRFGALQLRAYNPTIIHPHEIVRNYLDEEDAAEGVWFLRAQNVRPLRISTANQVYISTEMAESLKRNRLESSDVLVTRTGANRGDCAIYARNETTVASSHTFIIRPGRIDPTFLAVYFNSRYGRAQIDKGVYGAAQPEVAPYYLRNIWIPEVSTALTAAIRAVFGLSAELSTNAEQGTLKAEAALLSALGLAGWSPPEPLAYTARAADVIAAGRNDAQYFRPKYDALIDFMSSRHELVTLDGMVTKGRSVNYSEDGDVKIIRSGDLSNLDDDEQLLRADASEPITYLRRGDVLISSIGFGSIGKVQVFDKAGKFGTVSEVTIVRQNAFNPYYLAAFLSSTAGQIQIDRLITGATGQLHLYPRDVQKIHIPAASKVVQTSIDEMVQGAFAARARSRELLAAAMRAIEIAVEAGEAAAMAYLAEQTAMGAH